MDEEIAKIMGFSQFGKKDKTKKDMDAVLQQTRVESFETVENNNNNDTVVEDCSGLPVSNRVDFYKFSEKLVSSLAVNGLGTQVLASSFDGNVYFWDLLSADCTFRPHRQVTPFDNANVTHVEFSHNDDFILATGVSKNMKILNYAGHTKVEVVKGDQYINDLTKTNGHVAQINYGVWDPVVYDQFCTCSEDGTIRFWCTELCEFRNEKVIRFRMKGNPNKYVPILQNLYEPEGNNVVYGSASNGSFFWYDTRKSNPYMPTGLIEKVFEQEEFCCRFDICRQGRYLALRGNDKSLYVYDLRNTNKFLFKNTELYNLFDNTGVIFSPDGDYILTGTSAFKKNKGSSELCFFDTKNNFEVAKKISFENCSVLNQQWHARLNQIFVGTSSGHVYGYFDPNSSQKGVMTGITKKYLKLTDIGEEMIQKRVHLPYEQGEDEEAEQEADYLKLKSLARKDAQTTKRPVPPSQVQGPEPKIALMKSIAPYLVDEIGQSKKDEFDERPREALLRYSKKAVDDPFFVTPAYEKSQPKTLFAQLSEADLSYKAAGKSRDSLLKKVQKKN